MHTRTTLISSLALGLFTVASSAGAATAQVGVSAFAADVPAGVPFLRNDDGSLATGFSYAIRAVDAVAGNASSHAEAEADALKGALRAKVSADVAAARFVIGRNSGSTAGASMDGTITLTGTAPPGLATFSAVLEGTYSIQTPAPFDFPSFENRVEVSYSLHLADSPEFNDNLQFLCCGPGTFSIPFSWTQLVRSGDAIGFSLYMNLDAFSVAGNNALDLSNTFKITAVDLPPGFAFTAQDPEFLAQFNPTTTVPVPAAVWMFGSALGGLAFARRRVSSASGALQPKPM